MTNKTSARAFLELAFNQLDAQRRKLVRVPAHEADERLRTVGSHRVVLAIGGAEVRGGSLLWFVQIKRVVGEGDLVAVHSHLIREPGDRGVAVMDMFRLDAGKIVEHWDVLQDVPETSANSNTMF